MTEINNNDRSYSGIPVIFKTSFYIDRFAQKKRNGAWNKIMFSQVCQSHLLIQLRTLPEIEGHLNNKYLARSSKGGERALFAAPQLLFMFMFFHATDFVNISFTIVYKTKFVKITPFLVTKHCHHYCM